MSGSDLTLSDSEFHDAITLCGSATGSGLLARLDGASEAFVPDDAGDREVGILASLILTVLQRSAKAAVDTATSFSNEIAAVEASFSNADSRLATEARGASSVGSGGEVVR